jgi:hypothetical protein
MPTHLTDTNPAAEEFQISLFRRASSSEKLALAFSLSETVIQLSKRAIARANPGMSKRELDIVFVELHYGKELAEKVRNYFNRKEQEEQSLP